MICPGSVDRSWEYMGHETYINFGHFSTGSITTLFTGKTVVIDPFEKYNVRKFQVPLNKFVKGDLKFSNIALFEGVDYYGFSSKKRSNRPRGKVSKINIRIMPHILQDRSTDPGQIVRGLRFKKAMVNRSY